ncbi:bifunctional riboflavin kinase/FAD synthetase, partial [bacterium]
MIVLKDFDISYYDKKSVVSIGTFDGVHVGHRKIINDLNTLKSSLNLRSVIVTFDPHPQVVLKSKHKDIKLLSTTSEKLNIFEKLGIDTVYVTSFTREFSQTTAEDFYRNYIIEKVGLTDLVLGYDHMFGRNREGDYSTLKVLSQKHDFRVHRIEEFRINGEQVNSTTIRNLLYSGDVEKAAFLLGENYSFEGKVVYGDRRGQTIGFPTANIEPFDEFKLIPKNGVYLVSVSISDKSYFGMMNIGVRPTIDKNGKIIIEVNIFNFDNNIYGKTVKIGFILFLREERKFGSLDELVMQLKKDREK